MYCKWEPDFHFIRVQTHFAWSHHILWRHFIGFLLWHLGWIVQMCLNFGGMELLPFSFFSHFPLFSNWFLFYGFQFSVWFVRLFSNLRNVNIFSNSLTNPHKQHLGCFRIMKTRHMSSGLTFFIYFHFETPICNVGRYGKSPLRHP